MPVSPTTFKDGLARWVSGVTIVTARAGGADCGMTASSFSSVSLDPPLVLVCADKRSETHAAIASSGCFAVNVLSESQEELSRRFATEGNEAIRFEGLACTHGPTGAPLIPNALAHLECRVAASHDAGDHVIYVGEVERLCARDAEPLVYYRGGYRQLARR